jgi:hypothetical protein
MEREQEGEQPNRAQNYWLASEAAVAEQTQRLGYMPSF